MLTDVAARRLGSHPASVAELGGGLTSMRLWRLVLGDGRRLIVKGAPPPDPGDAVDWREVLRTEIAAYDEQPELNRWRPQRLDAFDDDGWAALVIEDLGSPVAPPWTGELLDAVARALAGLHSTPVARRPPLGVWPDYWARIEPRVRGGLPAQIDTPGFWTWFHRAAVAGSEAARRHADVPRAAIHGDVRTQNIFPAPGGIRFIDWQPAWDSPAMDSTFWAIDAEVEGGGPAPETHARYEAFGGAAGEGVPVALAIAGGFYLSRVQAKDGAAELRRRETSYLAPTLRWMAAELGIPPPPL